MESWGEKGAKGKPSGGKEEYIVVKGQEGKDSTVYTKLSASLIDLSAVHRQTDRQT